MIWFRVTVNATPPVAVQTPEPQGQKFRRSYILQGETFLSAVERALRVYASEVKLEPTEMSIHIAEEEIIPLVPLGENVPVSPSPKVVAMLEKKGKKEE